MVVLPPHCSHSHSPSHHLDLWTEQERMLWVGRCKNYDLCKICLSKGRFTIQDLAHGEMPDVIMSVFVVLAGKGHNAHKPSIKHHLCTPFSCIHASLNK